MSSFIHLEPELGVSIHHCVGLGFNQVTIPVTVSLGSRPMLSIRIFSSPSKHGVSIAMALCSLLMKLPPQIHTFSKRASSGLPSICAHGLSLTPQTCGAINASCSRALDLDPGGLHTAFSTPTDLEQWDLIGSPSRINKQPSILHLFEQLFSALHIKPKQVVK